MSTRKNIKEFASVDGQSTLPDPVVGSDAHRAADQSQGETSYSMTTKSEVLAAIMNNLANRPQNEVLDVFNSLSTTDRGVNARGADQLNGETGIIRLSQTAVGGDTSMESVGEIFTGTEISEELKTKAAVIFEATVNARISIVEAALQEQYQTALESAVEDIQTDLIEAVDKYLTYAAEEWVGENKLAIDSGIKVKMAENALMSLKSFFEENYITVQEDKIDILEEISNENEELKSKLNSEIEKSVKLSETIEEFEVKSLLDESAIGLTVSQKEKFFNLVENVSYSTPDELKSKVAIIKETYFNSTPSGSKTSAQPITEDFNGELTEGKQVSSTMSPYVNHLRRSSK